MLPASSSINMASALIFLYSVVLCSVLDTATAQYPKKHSSAQLPDVLPMLIRRPMPATGRRFSRQHDPSSAAEPARMPSTATFTRQHHRHSHRPHIIFILADDLGWNDVSFHGSKQIPTPNIDALAAGGIVLNNYYVTPLCTPSRGALMTGKYPSHIVLISNTAGRMPCGQLDSCLQELWTDAAVRVPPPFNSRQHDVIGMDQPWGLPLNETLLPEHLRRLGYRRHIIGKWHLGNHKATYTPLMRGFETHLGYWGGYIDYYDQTSEIRTEGGLGKNLRGHDFRRNMEPALDMKGRYATEVFTDHALNVIEHHNPREALFLYMSHLAVHSGLKSSPLQAPWKLVKDFMHIKDPHRRVYAAMMYAMDESVGKIVNALESRGMLENSIIIFSTDNGGAAGGINLNAASNWPLKGTKYTSWEGGVRGVGLIWSRLLSQNPRAVSDHMMHLVDWLPTLYSAAGGSTRDLGNIDGVNLWPALVRGNSIESPRRDILLDLDPICLKSAIRVDNWKLVNGTWNGGQFDKWFGPTGSEDGSSLFTDTSPKPNTPLSTKKPFLWQGLPIADLIPTAHPPLTIPANVTPPYYNMVTNTMPKQHVINPNSNSSVVGTQGDTVRDNAAGNGQPQTVSTMTIQDVQKQVSKEPFGDLDIDFGPGMLQFEEPSKMRNTNSVIANQIPGSAGSPQRVDNSWINFVEDGQKSKLTGAAQVQNSALRIQRRNRQVVGANEDIIIGAYNQLELPNKRERRNVPSMMAKALFEYNAIIDQRLQQPILNASNLLSPRRRLIMEGLKAATRADHGATSPELVLLSKSLIDCGPMPNASDPTYVKCSPVKAPCLFDLSTDPCEYWNRAPERPDMVEMLWKRLMEYQQSSVQPRNERGDPKADPKLWGYIWTNWKDFV